MSNPQIKDILDAIAKASSGVMKSADKAVPTQCENCGHPIDVPNRADTDYPNADGDQHESSEDR